MWTEEKLKEAATKYWRECTEILYHEHKRTTLEDASLAGCKYIINNTQKE